MGGTTAPEIKDNSTQCIILLDHFPMQSSIYWGFTLPGLITRESYIVCLYIYLFIYDIFMGL